MDTPDDRFVGLGELVRRWTGDDPPPPQSRRTTAPLPAGAGSDVPAVARPSVPASAASGPTSAPPALIAVQAELSAAPSAPIHASTTTAASPETDSSPADETAARLPAGATGAVPPSAAAKPHQLETVLSTQPSSARPGEGGDAHAQCAPTARETCGAPGRAESEAAETPAAVRDARLFRTALADALDAVVAALVRELARDVLARELLLAPADVAALAARLIDRHSADGPVRLRVAPGVADLRCDLPVIADAALEPGDAILECRSGGIDARLRTRLAGVVAAFSA